MPLSSNYVEVPDYDQNMKDYHVWNKDILDGCGNCGEAGHTFERCPDHNSVPRVSNPKKSGPSSSMPRASEGKVGKDYLEKEWTMVADLKDVVGEQKLKEVLSPNGDDEESESPILQPFIPTADQISTDHASPYSKENDLVWLSIKCKTWLLRGTTCRFLTRANESRLTLKRTRPLH